MEVIGIHKEDSNIRIACLSEANGEISIEFLEKQKDAFFSKKLPYIVTGIEGQNLLLRQIKTPLKKQRSIDKTIPFQLEALIPYHLNEVIVKPIYTPVADETQALFFIVSKKNFEKHVASYEDEGFSPRWVSAIPMALSRFALFVFPKTPNSNCLSYGAHKDPNYFSKRGQGTVSFDYPHGVSGSWRKPKSRGGYKA